MSRILTILFAVLFLAIDADACLFSRASARRQERIQRRALPAPTYEIVRVPLVVAPRTAVPQQAPQSLPQNCPTCPMPMK